MVGAGGRWLLHTLHLQRGLINLLSGRGLVSVGGFYKIFKPLAPIYKRDIVEG